MSVKELALAIKVAVDNRIKQEARALRGTICDGRFQYGSKSYPYKQAVDCNTAENSRVWAQLDNSGNAIIVGS